YPEFTGTITSTFLKDPVSSTNPNVVWQKAEEGIKKLNQFKYLSPMKFQDTYAIAVKSDLAKEHELTKISDLAKVSGLTAGF
ncbi:glycine betaine ABC transporter substrate-binding protein, partial [Lactococcus lactis]